ncbi:MAG: 4Fe-4S binding protein, partial [Candidatus Brocadiia bacterium]
MSLRVDHEVCTFCCRCIEACPYGALEDSSGRIRVTEQCNLCGACIEECPVGALSIEAEERRAAEAQAGGVWIYGEHHGARFHPVVRELVGKGAELAAARDCPLEVVTVG